MTTHPSIKRPKKLRARLLLAAAVLAFLATAPLPAAADAACQPTIATFQKLHTGQSLAQVQTIMGCAGIELAKSSTNTVVVQTFGAFPDGIVSVTLQNDRLVSKSQEGLQRSQQQG